MMYLSQVLTDIRKESAPPKTLRAEHLFKLNEAVFNLSEEDAVDAPLAVKLFQAVEKIQISYNTGKYDNTDSNFFYDYLALLGTMQNQHFFTQKQTEKMLSWIKEVVDGSELTEESGGKSGKSLEVENEKLRKRLAKYEDLPTAIRGIDEDKPAKGKGKAKSASAPEPEAKGKGSKGKAEDEGKGKNKGKGKGKVVEEYYEPAPAKGGKAKSGKGKAAPEPEPQEAKGKG
eukprot:CAMPEP_0115121834 /NCGR_PEP_ID=MMETSP0227-20121206/46468_1 /TAXON_ID=89957 /ORGANISM="Polarella glacialis, Strain CCMP 1383" /LENGTH=229 /DNA_ID=CAMNT_0002523661 /DNA_START=72 /DNA_END=757 /DNA_ORIENTATION=-